VYVRILRKRSEAGVTPSSGRRLPGIEGLRALAACCVLFYHAWAVSSPDGTRVQPWALAPVLPDLAFGVTLFFALSGFLLYRPFAAAVLRGRRSPSTRIYFRNRALRILPAYWVILIASGLMLQTVLVRSGDALNTGAMSDGELLLRTATFTQNLTPSTVGSGIGPAWSLAIEAVFYLVLPLLGLLAARLALRTATRRGLLAAAFAPAALMLLLGLSGKLVAAAAMSGPYGEWGNTWHTVVELSFWAQADLFAFGMAAAVLHVELEDGRLRLPRGWRLGAVGAALGGYLVVAKSTNVEDQLSSSPANTLMGLVCALVLALAVFAAPGAARPNAFLRFLELRFLVYVGVASYSVFLWHGPLVRWLRAHDLTFAGGWGLLANSLVLLGVTLVLSTLTYRLVEAPALRLKTRRREPAPAREPEPVGVVSHVPSAP
jgi:peptidoglycan/LPS O-acetylase OafA/YrhL